MYKRLYSSIVTTDLSPNVFEQAKSFAKKVTLTTNYEDSNQVVNEKIINDHYISKLGEEAVKKVLSKYAVVTGPDYGVYEEKQKSWADDLFINGVGVAVKTQKRSVAMKYGLSWTFQAGNVRRDPILNRPDAWIAFVEFDDISTKNFKVYPLVQVKELSFGQPKLTYLIGHKLVVYAYSLPKFLE